MKHYHGSVELIDGSLVAKVPALLGNIYVEYKSGALSIHGAKIVNATLTGEIAVKHADIYLEVQRVGLNYVIRMYANYIGIGEYELPVWKTLLNNKPVQKLQEYTARCLVISANSFATTISTSNGVYDWTRS